MIDIGQATAMVARHVSDVGELVVVQRSHDHIVLDAGNAIVKCGTRDDFGIEAWACERARSLGVPAPNVIALDRSASVPYLVLSKVAGVPLHDHRLPLDLAARGAREAGAMTRRLHELPLAGFGWVDQEHFRRTGNVQGKSRTWLEEITVELEGALQELVALGALSTAQADALRAAMTANTPAIEAVGEGRFLHGDLGRMHTFVDPDDGAVTGLIDWGDVQVGDPLWDLAITACHLGSPSEGLLRVHLATHPDLFPYFLEGYEPTPALVERLEALGSFYLVYRRAWVARLGPGEGGVANPSLAMLLQGFGEPV